MKLFICCLLFSLMLMNGNAQTCLDSSRVPDPTYQCNADYEPVCGCDNVTYRNACAAYNWGGLFNDGFYTGWTEGTVCGSFDFELNPTAVSYYPVKFEIFIKDPGSATLYIYNRYGGLLFTDYFNASYTSFKTSREYDFTSLEYGIYLAVVIANGEQQTIKFAKVVDE